jgi:hypothetical protein
MDEPSVVATAAVAVAAAAAGGGEAAVLAAVEWSLQTHAYANALSLAELVHASVGPLPATACLVAVCALRAGQPHAAHGVLQTALATLAPGSGPIAASVCYWYGHACLATGAFADGIAALAPLAEAGTGPDPADASAVHLLLGQLCRCVHICKGTRGRG